MKATEVLINEGVITIVPQIELGTKFYFLYNNSIKEGVVSSYNIKIVSKTVGPGYGWLHCTWWTRCREYISRYFNWCSYPKEDAAMYIKYNCIEDYYSDEDSLCEGYDGYWRMDKKGVRVYFDRQDLINSFS